MAAGRITEINGLEGTGKSLIGAHALASTQKKGGLAVYIDTESAVSAEFLQSIGVDTKSMMYIHLETVEDIFDAIETIVTKIRESDNDRLVTILVDSLAAASTKVEMDADFDKDGWATSKAIVLSKAMRKITQMIARIRLKNMGQIKDTKKNTIGIKIRAQVIKNRLGPPLRSAEFPLYFDKGIDDFGSWLTIMKDHKLVKQAGAWYTYTDQNGKDHKFQSKDFGALISDEETQKYIYKSICEKIILKYDSAQLGIDDVTTEDEFADE